jgi:two-component system, OmpR family, sensor histidine kinase BaeS
MKKIAMPALHSSLDDANQRGDELARRLQNQATMIGVVAHDLRLPLFRLALSLELASSAEGDHSTLVRHLEAIRAALDGITRLVDDLDDYGSLQAGQLRLVCRPVHPATIVKSALVAFAPVAAARNVELSEHVGDSLPEVLVDDKRLLQIVSNLLTNALCLTPSGGRVVVAVEGDGNDARFVVADSGPGISKADLPHLFERYWRGAHGKYVGRGLGLAIARDLVERHGGQIWADNSPEGGARISFTVRAVRTS